MKTNQGVAQNLLVNISMVLWAQIFGLSGCIAKPTWLHACHGALPSVEQGAMRPSMWPNNQPPCIPHFAHGKFESWSTSKSISIKGIKQWKYCIHPNEWTVGKNEGIAYTHWANCEMQLTSLKHGGYWIKTFRQKNFCPKHGDIA